MKRCLSCESAFSGGAWVCPTCGATPEQLSDIPVFSPALAEESDGFSAAYFAGLARDEEGHFWFESRNALLTWAVRRYFPGAKSLLEIGCGTGFVLTGLHRALPDLAISGSEIFLCGLEFASRRLPGVQLYQMDARRIPFEQEFDVIGAFDVIEHIEEDQLVLHQMFRAVRPGGGILLTVPQHPWLWSTVDDISFHKRRYRRRELISRVRSAGFTVTRCASFVSLLLPLMMAARLSQKHAAEIDRRAEFKISPRTNSLMRGVMRIERSIIQSGVNLPAGGSLFLIAHRPAAS